MPIRKQEQFGKYFIADTKEEAMELLEEYKNTMSLLARKAANLTGLDFEDLYQEAIIGLARAKRDFDKERSTNFKIFAIYKIKDAIREFETTQATSIKVPQYMKDAVRSANMLRKYLMKVGEYKYTSLNEIWDISFDHIDDIHIGKAIRQIQSRLLNLANRSHVPIKQLLERAEITPVQIVDPEDAIDINFVDHISSEDDIIDKLNAIDIINHIKEQLSEEEFNLLVNRYIKGMTLRELAPKMGISAAHVSDITQKIFKKLRLIMKNLSIGNC